MGEALREIDAGVIANPDGFRTQITEPCVPAVLRGACRDWPARRAGEDTTAASFAYLRRFDSGATGQAFVGARGIGGRYHYGEGPDGFVTQLREPCVRGGVGGACRDWPVGGAGEGATAALFAYLRRFDSGATGQAVVGARGIGGRYHYGEGPDGFNFARETLGLDGLLSRIEGARDDPDGRSIYMGSVPTDTLLPGFADENRLGFLPLAIRPRIWLGTASQVACHYDTFDNIACVVAGRRRFTLYPPDEIGDLSEIGRAHV